MIKTLKEFINDHIKIFREFMIKKANNENIDNYVSDFGNILKEILQAHENEIAKKDKKHIEQLKRMYEQFKHDKELEIGQYKFENEQQILFKEDFDLTCYAECNCDGEGWGYGLIDNSKYDKLPSKEDETCI